MAEIPDVIGATLRYPDAIRKSTRDPATVRPYYKWFLGTVVGDKWVCVVVKRLDGDPFVITAYVTEAIKEGESI